RQLINNSAETVVSRKSDWRHASSSAASGTPWREIGFGPHTGALPPERPAQTLTEHEGGRIRQAAVAVTLQRHALPSCELGQLDEREHKHLSVLADDRDRIRGLGDQTDHRDARSGTDVDQLLTLPRFGVGCLAARDETLAVGGGDQQFHL